VEAGSFSGGSYSLQEHPGRVVQPTGVVQAAGGQSAGYSPRVAPQVVQGVQQGRTGRTGVVQAVVQPTVQQTGTTRGKGFLQQKFAQVLLLFVFSLWAIFPVREPLYAWILF
jgi:hypothetical protein